MALKHFDETAAEIVVGRPAASTARGLKDRQLLALVAVERTHTPMVITDPKQADNPIILANQAFLDLTGYAAEEVVGRNCRFLQGPETASDAVEAVRRAVTAACDIEIELVNYRRDGTTFWNQLQLSPVHDGAGQLIYFFASQRDVTDRREAQTLRAEENRLLREVDHRAMNALALVQGIVRLSRADTAAGYAASVQGRVSALARAHTLLSRASWRAISLSQVLRDELEPYGAERIRLNGPDIEIPPEQVQPLFLLTHELVSNALAHGALAQAGGLVDVSWWGGDNVEIRWTEQGAVPAAVGAPGFGTRMIDSIAKQQLRGSVSRTWRDDGLRLAITFPALDPQGHRPAADLSGSPAADSEGPAASTSRSA